MRDGILESIANLDTAVDPAQARCTVWDAFAQFGVGVGASGQEICALGLCLFQAAESFVKPPECPTGPANMAPVPTILLPTPGTTVLVGTSVNFSGSATDDLDGDLTASMSWASSLQGAIGAGGAFSRTDLVVGTHVITASVTDSGALVGTATVSITVQPSPNTPPSVTISSPPNGTTVAPGASVTFTATATDTQDGNVAASLVWSSNLQGQIGIGASFSTTALGVGAHAITASVTDSGGLPGSASVVVTVQSLHALGRGAEGQGQEVRRLDVEWDDGHVSRRLSQQRQGGDNSQRRRPYGSGAVERLVVYLSRVQRRHHDVLEQRDCDLLNSATSQMPFPARGPALHVQGVQCGHIGVLEQRYRDLLNSRRV